MNIPPGPVPGLSELLSHVADLEEPGRLSADDREHLRTIISACRRAIERLEKRLQRGRA